MNQIRMKIAVMIFLLSLSCVRDSETVSDLSETEPEKSVITFIDATAEAELFEPLKGIKGHSAASGDFNNDGFPDLFVGTYGDRNPDSYNKRGHTTGPNPDKLFINSGNGKFFEYENTPVNILGRCSGSVFSDFDNDGDLDFVAVHNKAGSGKINGKGVYIFRNDSGFTDLTEYSGIYELNNADVFNGRNAFVLDYNGDGFLDIFFQEDHVRSESGENSTLMRNNGNFIFTDVTAEAGISENLYGLGGICGDINGDTWPDLYFAHSDVLFINNKNSTFTEIRNCFLPVELSLPEPLNHNWPCSANSGDLDNDGDMDIVIGEHFTGDMNHRIYVFLNEGNNKEGIPFFREITEEAGILYSQNMEPNIQIEDFNNDGFLDIITASEDNFIYQNLCAGSIPVFSKPLSAPKIKGGSGQWSSGTVFDYNRDGLPDIFLPEWEPDARSLLLKNVTENAGNYIDVSLNLQNCGNIFGVGATVRLYEQGRSGEPDALIGIRVISISNGFSSGNEAIAHFGTGNVDVVDIVVNMPCNGKVYRENSISVNQLYTFR